ncbi:MAG: LEA type 2 family protein [Treponema sp.]|nr:LEA type 2 family protein [Treponema sp.]
MRRLRYVLLLFLIPAVFFAAVSCQTLASIVQEPKVSVRTVDLDKISFTGADMICRLDVENPNAFDIPFPEVDWELYINSNQFISGILSNSTKLGANRTVTVDVPFSVTYAGLFNTFTSLIDSDEAGYRIALGIKFPLRLIGDKTFNLEYSGNIPMLKLPKISGAAFKTGRIDLTGVQQDWTFMVENPNVFPLPLPQMNWEYGAAGVTVQSGSTGTAGIAGEIPAQSQSPVTVTVGVKFADLISALGSLGDSSQLQSLMSISPHFPVPAFENLNFDSQIQAMLPVFRTPSIAFHGLNIKNLGFQKLDFVVSWEIDNPNDFPLDLGNFNYNLNVNDSSWAQGNLASPPRLEANSKTVVPLDFTVSALNLITQIIDIINRGASVNFNTAGNFDFSGSIPGLDKMNLPFDLSGVTKLLRL